MKSLRSHAPSLLFLLAAACSGVAGPADDGDRGDGDADVGTDDDTAPQGPLSDNALVRIPHRTLTCDDPRKPGMAAWAMGRLTEDEYLNSIRDLIAPLTFTNAPDFPLVVGTATQYSNDHRLQDPSQETIKDFSTAAEGVGKLVAGNLAALGIPDCPPAGDDDGPCLGSFMDRFVKRAYRRPLTDDERGRLQAFFGELRQNFSFAESLEVLVNGVLQSPQFLYKLEFGDGSAGDDVKLSGYELAARLSYLLWDTLPDTSLLAAAEAGELDSIDGLMARARDMLGDERASRLSASFARDFIGLDKIDGRARIKDQAQHPEYDGSAADALMESLRRFVASTMGAGGSHRDLLTSNKAFVNESIAPYFGLREAPRGDDFAVVELDTDTRRGLLTHPGLLAGLSSSEKRTAAIFRGLFVMERLLCMEPPHPPDNIDVSPPPEQDGDAALTSREWLVERHEAQNGVCYACHRVIDNIGFAFENYDTVGQFVTEEAGKTIDASAFIEESFDVDGEYTGAVGLAETLAASEQVAQCFVEGLYRFTFNRGLTEEDGCNIAAITDRVVSDDADLEPLLLAILRTRDFRYRRLAR